MKLKAPWLEGFLLASFVGGIFLIGGETLRASYHGFLHTAIGESVAREGLVPDNPYHAGEPLRYYTLYPWLGVSFGRFLGGPFWGFAFLSVLAAFLFGPSLDALGRSLGLSFGARRGSFLAALLGFNAWGWVFAVGSDTSAALGQAPIIFSKYITTFFDWHWDARLQSVLPKFLNVSSFALALAPAMWALATSITDSDKPRRFIFPGAIALALNPLVGGVMGLMVAVSKVPLLWRDFRAGISWLTSGVIACLVAFPFLLSLFTPAPQGEQLTGEVAFQASFANNFLGSLGVMLLGAFFGVRFCESTLRNRFFVGILVITILASCVNLPWANEYKLFRLLGIGLAFPCGIVISRMWNMGGLFRGSILLLGVTCLPTSAMVVRAYTSWGKASLPLPFQAQDGRIVVHEEASFSVLPVSLAVAEREAPVDAVLVMDLNHPGSHLGGGVVQGNALAGVLHHPLFVDLPQIHNARIEDLRQRLGLVRALYDSDTSSEDRVATLLLIKSIVNNRPLLVLCPPNPVIDWAALESVNILAEEGGFLLLQI